MKECLHLSELSGFVSPRISTRTQLAAVFGSLGAIERGLETAHLALAIAKKVRPGFSTEHVPATLAQLHLSNDNLAEAEAALDLGRREASQEYFNVYSVPLPLAEAELALRQGDYKRALAVTDKLLANLRQSGARAYMPGSLYLQARTLLAQGQNEAGHDRLQEARTEAEAIGSRRMLWQVLSTLSQLETDPAEATQLRLQAREIVGYIAGNVGDPGLAVQPDTTRPTHCVGDTLRFAKHPYPVNQVIFIQLTQPPVHMGGTGIEPEQSPDLPSGRLPI